MTELFSGYDKSTQELVFRVYAAPLPVTEKRQKHKDAHFAALDLLGAALAEDFGVRHAVIRRVGLGKPQLIHDFLHINISHCKGLAVAACGTVPLGVDAEVPRAVRESLLQKVCTAEEIVQIKAADDENSMFSRFWTLKEAYAKYTGEGIGLDFSTLGFSFSENGAVTFAIFGSDDSTVISVGYGSAEQDRHLRRRPARQLLHAVELSFLHPITHRRVTFAAPPPEDIVYA